MRELERLKDYELHALATHLHCHLIIITNERDDFLKRLESYQAALKREWHDKPRQGMYYHRVGLLKDAILLQDEAIKAGQELLGELEKLAQKRGIMHPNEWVNTYGSVFHG